MKQFVRTMKYIVFGWYTDQPSKSINSWKQTVQEFFIRFYSTQCTVSTTKLTTTKQWKDESVFNYMNHKRAVSLEWKEQLSKASAVGMCTHYMSGTYNICY